MFIIKIIGVTTLSIKFNIKSYGVTILLFLAAYVITLISAFISELKYSIVDFIKFNQKADKGMKGSIAVLILGIITISCAIMIMFNNYDFSENNVFISMLIFFIGLYIVTAASMIFISLFKSLFRNKYYKNLVFISNLKHDFNKTKKVLVVMIALITFSEVLLSLAITCSYSLSKNALTYNVYDVAYASIYNKNELEKNKIDEIMGSGETNLNEEKELKFMRNGAFTIFPVDELDKECNRDYKVEKGKFILIFSYDMHDGYGHEKAVKVNMTSILIEGENENLTLGFQESNIDIIIGNIYSFASYKIIVNDEDYNKIKEDSLRYREGILHLFSFEDWTKTESIVENLKSELSKNNDIQNLRDARLYKVSSKVESYTKAKQADIFLITVIIFMSMLLIFSTDVMMHFKLIMDLENEKKYYSSLCKIGMSYDELGKIINKKLKLVFLMPVILSSLIASMYNYQLGVLCNLNDKGIRFTLYLCIVIIVIQWIVYIFYKKYFKRLVNL